MDFSKFLFKPSEKKVLPKKSRILSRNIYRISEYTMAIQIGKRYNGESYRFHHVFENLEFNLSELEHLRDYIEIFFDETKHFPDDNLLNQLIEKVKSENITHDKIPILNLLN